MLRVFQFAGLRIDTQPDRQSMGKLLITLIRDCFPELVFEPLTGGGQFCGIDFGNDHSHGLPFKPAQNIDIRFDGV